MLRLASRLYVAAIICTCLGCAKSIYPVKGRVHFADGTPLTQGRVVVDSGKEMTGSWGLIHPDGTFEMGTNTANDGVPPGRHRVYLQNTMTAPPPGFTGLFKPQPLVHPRFTTPESSGLAFEVPGQVEWEIVVEKP
jgi:hypothetical protein